MTWRPLDYLAVAAVALAIGGMVFGFEIVMAEQVFDYDLMEGLRR